MSHFSRNWQWQSECRTDASWLASWVLKNIFIKWQRHCGLLLLIRFQIKNWHHTSLATWTFPLGFCGYIYFPTGEIYSSYAAITVPGLHIMSAPPEAWAQISGQHLRELRTGLNYSQREDYSRLLHTHAIFYLPVSLKIVTWTRVSLPGTHLGQVIQPMQ